MVKELVSPEAVKKLRVINNWSQSELAVLSKTTTRTISGIENETKQTRQVQRKVFNGLCEAFDEREEVLRGNEPINETDQKIKTSFEIEWLEDAWDRGLKKSHGDFSQNLTTKNDGV